MSKCLTYLGKIARRFRDETGATAVEFTVLLPVILVTFAIIVEGSRIYWNYQAAVSGVRDASRYLARITNNDVCNGGTAPANAGTIARGIIDRNLGDGGGNLFPVAVRIIPNPNSVPTAAVTCPTFTANSTTFTAPVWRVTATVQIDLPLASLWGFFRTPQNGQMQSTIVDQSRIYGL